MTQNSELKKKVKGALIKLRAAGRAALDLMEYAKGLGYGEFDMFEYSEEDPELAELLKDIELIDNLMDEMETA